MKSYRHTHQNLGWVKYKLHNHVCIHLKQIHSTFSYQFCSIELKRADRQKATKSSPPPFLPSSHSIQTLIQGTKEITCEYSSRCLNINQSDLPFKLSAKLTSASVTGPTSWWTTRSSQSCESNVENISSRASMEPYTSALKGKLIKIFQIISKIYKINLYFMLWKFYTRIFF